MSIEAFIWNYRNGEPIGFDFDTVRDILSTNGTNWSNDDGCLSVPFQNPAVCVDIFLSKGASKTNHTDGIMVSRPITHQDYLQRVFRVMELGDVMLFYSDETTPVFVAGANSGQYPNDLLKELGEPRYVESPTELLHQS